MNAQGLQTQDTLLLLTHREAIRSAAKTRQLRQFIHAHETAGRWAHALSLQRHGNWLTEDDSEDPYGIHQPDTGRFLQGATWLLSKGWQPDPEAIGTLLTHLILDMSTPAHEPGTPAPPEDRDFNALLASLAHLDANGQAHVAEGIVGKISTYNLLWQFPRFQAVLEWMSEDAVLAMEETTSAPANLALALDERKADAQAGRLRDTTPVATGPHRAPRM